MERLGFSVLYSTDDQKEGLKAFLRNARPNLSENGMDVMPLHVIIVSISNSTTN